MESDLPSWGLALWRSYISDQEEVGGGGTPVPSGGRSLSTRQQRPTVRDRGWCIAPWWPARANLSVEIQSSFLPIYFFFLSFLLHLK